MDLHDHIETEQYMNFFSDVAWIAKTCNYLGRINEALDLLLAVEQLFPLSPLWKMDKIEILLIHAELQITNCFLTNSNFDKALKLAQYVHQQAEESWSMAHFDIETGNALDVSKALCLLGQVHYYSTKDTDKQSYDEALPFFLQSWKMYEKMQETRELSLRSWIQGAPEIVNDLGPYNYTDDYFTRRIDQHASKTLFYIGLVYESSQDIAQAQDFYQRSLDLALLSDSKEEASHVYSHLANICENKEQQLEYALQALHLREEIGFKRMLPVSCLHLGALYLKRNEFEKAEEYCQTALQLANEMNIKRALIKAFFLQGEIYQLQGDLNMAREQFLQSQSLAEELGLASSRIAAPQKRNEMG
jgi:tetratricopeptide (TPR) repeat protein